MTVTSLRRPTADLEVVIPAYNEAERLGRTLEATVAFLADQPWDSRIVVVDNGSVDDTAGIARRAAATSAVPIVVVGCSRPGKGAAGGRIVEVPVQWTDDARSTLDPIRDGVPGVLAVAGLALRAS